MADERCFTWVCLRRLEEDITLVPDVEEQLLSHDRRLLALRTRCGRILCYSCDNVRPAFSVKGGALSDVQNHVWLHLPAEKNVLLQRGALSESPGLSCLLALRKNNSTFVFSRFFCIESCDAEVVDESAHLASCAVALEQAEPLIRWASRGLPDHLLPNQIWRCEVSVESLVVRFPDIVEALANPGSLDAEGDQGPGARCLDGLNLSSADIRLHVPQEDTLLVIIKDLVAILFRLAWAGIFVRHCYFLQRPQLVCEPSVAPLRFDAVAAVQEWIFAITPPPDIRLLIWHITGVAFHAVCLGDHLPQQVRFTSIVVALDLLGIALSDNHHDVWVVALDRYFDTSLQSFDWELVKDRQRCAQDVGMLGQTSKDYQDLSVFPEAFGLQAHERSGNTARRLGVHSSVLDCLVEGVPTYGIPIPGGPFGLEERHFDGATPFGLPDTVLGGKADNVDSAVVGVDAVTRSAPLAWHERIHYSQEWSELERPWLSTRVERAARSNGAAEDGSPTRPSGQQLNGFSIPAQHKLGDDDLHYSLCIALNRHARRQFESRLPPWLTKARLRQRSQPFNPPLFDTFDRTEDDVCSDSDWTSADLDEGVQDHVSPATKSSGQPLPKRARIGRLRLSMTATHVFCEIWETAVVGSKCADFPWGLCAIPRAAGSRRNLPLSHRQVDHLTGSLIESLPELHQQEMGNKQTILLFRSRRRWRSLSTQNQIWYMLSEGGGLYALLLNQSPVRIVSNLLIFESKAKASRLCVLNNWNPKQLPILTLFLGLRFRQLDEIRRSLTILKPDQEMEACQMIMDFIKAGYSCAPLKLPFSPSPMTPLTMKEPSRTHSQPPSSWDQATGPIGQFVGTLPADRSFVSRLLEAAVQFVTKLVHTRVAQIQECDGACRAITYLQPAHAAREPQQFAAMVHELAQLTVHMQSLRSLQQQLISSFSDDRNYDKGIHLQCLPQVFDEHQASTAAMKTGFKSLDDAVALATKLQAGGWNSLKDRSVQFLPLRSSETAEAIVRGALLSGHISSALNWFHELSASGGTDEESTCVFSDFRVTAGRLAYQLVCNQQLDFLFVAMHMLRNIGESVNRFFKAVAFHTSKRLVRRRLLRHVNHMGRLSDAEQTLISLVNLLEELYTNPCYTTELNRMTTRLTTAQYPLRGNCSGVPAFFTWPAGGRSMFAVGLKCDGAIGGHLNVHEATESADNVFEQQTSLRELPLSHRMPLELYDMWAGYQMPVMAAMLEMPIDARRAWGHLPCGDIDDLDSQPVLGLSNFHKSCNLEKDQDTNIADFRDCDVVEGESDMVSQAAGIGTWTTCRRCTMESGKSELEFHKGTETKMLSFLDALGIGERRPKHFTMGYLHVTLSWMTCWNWDTRARVVMEKSHFQPQLLKSLPCLQPPLTVTSAEQAWRHCWLDFLVAHQDWRGLAAWVRRLPLEADHQVDSHGKSSVDMSHLEKRGRPGCTSYTKEILSQELGRRGIFCEVDMQSFPTLLRRLARCGRLFGDGQDPHISHGVQSSLIHDTADGGDLSDSGALSLDRLLPNTSVCPFHRFFIHFCIEYDLPTVLLLYLQRYDLATTQSALDALELSHIVKPWASLLLLGRLGNAHLFAASLQHALILFADGSGPGMTKSSDSIRDQNDRQVPLNILAHRSPIAFLATLMFVPMVSVLGVAPAGDAAPGMVDLTLFHEVIGAYPALNEAFFPRRFDAVLGAIDVTGSSGHDALASKGGCGQAAAARRAQQTPHGQHGRLGDSISGSPSAAATMQTCQALQSMTTLKRDMSLSKLLSDVVAFDVDSALEPLPLFRTPLKDDDRSLASLVAVEETFRDELEEGYFLAQGRAMMAFHVLLAKCLEGSPQCQSPQCQLGELKFPLVLSAQDASRLDKVAKSVAFHNLLNEGVVSSAVCLLELCSLETEMLRVDVQAAKRIYEHHMQQGRRPGSDELDWPRMAAANVIELFLSFPDIQDKPNRAADAAINSGHLLTALRMLEESTWALDPHPSAPSVSSLQALAYDSPWHLVALFCRVHSLPRSLTLLHELARNNDWVMFLHESDLQQCPADTVLDVVNGYFTDVPLQSHLRILAHTIAAQELDQDLGCRLVSANAVDERPHSEREDQAVASGKLKAELEAKHVDAIGFLEQCRRGRSGQAMSTGVGLLRNAWENRIARLAVVATAFSDVLPLQCMTAWLSVHVESSSSRPVVALMAMTPPAEVASQIAALCRKNKAFSLVLRALRIFDPSNPLADFVKFHRAFVQCRFQSCREHLKRFVCRRNAELPVGQRPQNHYCLELFPHVTRLSEEMVQYLLEGFPRARMTLLSALDQAKFSPHYSHLFRSFRLIQQVGLDVDFRMPAAELLQLLISRKMFAEAREWACNSGVVSDTIVFEEVTGMIVEFRQGAWWNVLDERLQLWHKCYDAFLQQSYPPVGAALFFLDITSKLEPDLFAREQLILLCIAYVLLGTSGLGSPGAAGDGVPSVRSDVLGSSHVEKIKLSILLILTGTNEDLAAELEFSPLDLSYGTVRSLVHRVPEGVVALPLYHQNEGGAGPGSLPPWNAVGASKAGGGGGPSAAALVAESEAGPRLELLPFLETAISSLVNRDEIVWARQLAEGFSFESRDLQLAEAMEAAASGRMQDAMAGVRSAGAGSSFPSDCGTSPNIRDGDIERVLTTLSAQCSCRISLFCRRRMVCFAVSRAIGMDYNTVSQIEIGELLDRLLDQPRLSDISLCRSLLSCYPRPLNKTILAEVLANRFVLSTSGPYFREWAEDDLDEFVSLLGSAQETLGDAALHRIPAFAKRPRSFSLSSCSYVVKDERALAFDCEVEVVIMAYHAYVQACSERSIGELLLFLRERVPTYIAHKHFPLLVRLLVAIPEYHSTEYIFGHLVNHNRMDLLLAFGQGQKNERQSGKVGGTLTPSLAIALVRYLQEHYPRNLELQVQVHLCFGMEGQLANLLEQRAWQLTRSLGRRWEDICTQEGEEQLLTVLALFLQCSRFFLKAKRYQRHLIANAFASLICVQLKAVQIHLAASLQEQQNLAPRPGSTPIASATFVDCFSAEVASMPGLPLGGAATRENEASEYSLASVEQMRIGVEDSQLPLFAPAAAGSAAGAGEGATATLATALAGAENTESAAHVDRLGAIASTLTSAVGALPTGTGHGEACDRLHGEGDPWEFDTVSLDRENLQVQAPFGSLGSAGDPFVVVNMDLPEVEVFAEYHQDFVVAFQVVSAYMHLSDKGLCRVWPRALYRQVVLVGNFRYLQLFMRHLPLTKEYLDAVVRLYHSEVSADQFPQRAKRMKVLLREGVPNLEVRYQLARQVGADVDDVQQETV